MKTILSVNINKIALIRNSRGQNNPNILDFIDRFIQLGIQSITIHPRPDERHIRFEDAFRIKKNFPNTELNIEGYPSKKTLELITNVRPTQFTLVPDEPDTLTSNNGWDCQNKLSYLKNIIKNINKLGIRTSIFLNPETQQVPYAQKTGAHRIELYTESYAKSYDNQKENKKILQEYKETSLLAKNFGLEVNAGHDLTSKNLKKFIETIPNIAEVSIGHALITQMLVDGIEKTIKEYQQCLN